MERDDAQMVVVATQELIETILERNAIDRSDVVSVIFTSTPDLTAEFPAAAARRLGLDEVPLLCATEIAVPGSVERCVRVLMHAYTERDRARLRHVYLGGARALRSDLPE